jgi:hypothetical protein
MSKLKFTRREMEVPADVLAEVSALLLAADITPVITGADEENNTVTLTVEYDKEQKDAIHEAEEVIENYYDDDGDGEEED